MRPTRRVRHLRGVRRALLREDPERPRSASSMGPRDRIGGRETHLELKGRSRRCSWARPNVPPFATKQRDDSRADLVANLSDTLDGLALGILERPVVSFQTWDGGALLAASHGDEHVRVERAFVRELSWLLIGEIDSDLAHGSNHLG